MKIYTRQVIMAQCQTNISIKIKFIPRSESVYLKRYSSNFAMGTHDVD